MYLNILNEIGSTQWAMLDASFDGLLRGVAGELTPKDYELFHRLDEDTKAATLSFLGPRVEESFYTRINGALGSLFINGPIVPRATMFSQVSGLVSLDALTDEYLALENNPEVEKVLLVIDSPGGAVKGLTDFVQVLKAGKKPLEAINIGMMASAAYWIGSAADKLYSVDTGITGSIGVILTVDNPDKESRTVIRSAQSPNKNMEPDTDAGKAELQRIVDDLGAIFVRAVAENRGVSEKTVLTQYGRGSVFVAEDANVRGMIDGILSLRDYVGGGAVTGSLEGSRDLLVASEDEAAMDNNTDNLEVNQMSKSLKELRAEFPNIEAEIDELKAAERNAVYTVAAKVAPILNSKEYGASIKALAVRVLTDESNYDSLESAVAAVDETRTNRELEAAAADTDEAGETPPASPNAETLSEDGSIETEADFNAALDRQRALI